MKSTGPKTNLLLLRRDLRLSDNHALVEAAGAGEPVLAVLCWPGSTSPSSPGAVAAAWYLQNIASLQQEMESRYGLRLAIAVGSPAQLFRSLNSSLEIGQVFMNAGHDPPALSEELDLQQATAEAGVRCSLLPANSLLPTGAVLNKDGRSFKVFTPFYKRFLERYRHAAPLPAPDGVNAAGLPGKFTEIQDLLEELPEAARIAASRWEAGEQAARDCLESFIDSQLKEYGSERHSLEISGTSRISAWLQAGVVSARQVWDMVSAAMRGNPALHDGGTMFLRQLVWREFAMQVLDDHPELPDRPLQEKFAAFPWQEDAEALQAWQEARTGYPVVDAAMRQLKAEGWMPGRARMVVASFLVKHLLQPWQHGEAWFREWLIDYDLSCNAFNWQWVAGCGTDAAPYFRIFNPILQGRKFDGDGSYVREWIPELAGLPDRVLHSPWEASPLELQAAGLELGRDYPQPVVEHGFARERALASLKQISA